MYDDILLPTDGSAGIRTVVDHAGSLASVHDARIHALYVVNTASLTGIPMESSWEGVTEALREEGAAALEDVEKRVTDVPVETETAEGSPSREIVEYARERGCDVIAMGTHGRSGFDRLLLGSVAERVVRSSPVPVLTIRVGNGAT